MSFAIRCLPLLLLACASTHAATYQVGPGRTWTQLQPLFDAVDLQPGDIVEVDGGVTYSGNIILREADGGAPGDPVTLRGLRVNGQRPILLGGANTIEFRLANLLPIGLKVAPRRGAARAELGVPGPCREGGHDGCDRACQQDQAAAPDPARGGEGCRGFDL